MALRERVGPPETASQSLRALSLRADIGETRDRADNDRPLHPLFALLSAKIVTSAVLEIMQMLGGVGT